MRFCASFEEYWRRAKGLIDRGLNEEIGRLPFSSCVKRAVRGGKRFRGTLTILVAESLGASARDALPYAVAVELIHQGTLIHDDFIDGHERRRGEPALYRLLDPRRAFLIADMMLAYAQSKVLGTRDGYKVLAGAILETCRGACSEPLNPLRLLQGIKALGDPASFYMRLIRLKTAELFGAASRLGAIAARAPSWARRRAYDYGIHIGMAYQLADDLADYRLACEGQIDLPALLKLAPAVYLFRPLLGPRLMYYIVRRNAERISKLLSEADLSSSFNERLSAEVEMAEREATRFPDSPYKPLLLEAPKYLVDRMLSQAA